MGTVYGRFVKPRKLKRAFTSANLKAVAMTKTTYVTKRTTVVATRRSSPAKTIAKKAFLSDTISAAPGDFRAPNLRAPDKLDVDGNPLWWNGAYFSTTCENPFDEAQEAPADTVEPAPSPTDWGDQNDYALQAEASADCDCFDVVMRCSPSFLIALLELRRSGP